MKSKRGAMKSKRGAMKAASEPMKGKKKTGRAPIIGRGRLARYMVMSGRRVKTTGGLTKAKMMVNKRGKIVSRKAHASGHKRYKQIKGWVDGVIAARHFLKAEGFVAINGRSLLGKQLYLKSKALYGEKVKVKDEQSPNKG